MDTSRILVLSGGGSDDLQDVLLGSDVVHDVDFDRILVLGEEQEAVEDLQEACLGLDIKPAEG